MICDYPLADAIAQALGRDPDQPCVQYEGEWRTRGAIAAAARQATAVLEAGGAPQDRAVGLVLRNRPTGFAALAGLVAAGRTVVLISPFQSPAAIAADVAKLQLAAVIAPASDWSDEVVEAARAAGTLGVSLSEAECAATAVEGLRFEDRAEHARHPGVGVQMLTSGTTGAPKRIPLSRVGLSTAIRDQVRMAAAMGEAPPKAGLAAALVQYAPMVQLSGLFNALQAAFEAKPLVLMDKFEPQAWVASLRACRQHMLALPPAMMRMVLELDPPRDDLASLRSVRSGAAPLDDHTRDTFEQRYGVPVLSIYGATEFVGPIASWSLDDHARFGASKRGSVGKVWPDIARTRIVAAETGEELASGETGLLEVQVGRSGPDWIRTNDLGTIDADGFLFIYGRADDAINRGGFKIPPDVIGNALRTHPAVYDAAAVGLPDKRLGQAPAAAVELRPGAEPVTEAELIAYARSKLIAYQVPVRILIVPALPRTPAQKINRPGVYALFEAEAAAG
jgi:acyl-CoA synthetase (AMP-forming)/AMP-acid ligase II